MDHDANKNQPDQDHTDKDHKIVELNAEETEQVVGGKHADVAPERRIEPRDSLGRRM